MSSRLLALALVCAASPALAADGGVAPDGGAAAGPTFLGQPDDAILRRLCDQPIERMSVNRAGTTVKLKAHLADGTKASLRPAQLEEAGNYRADVAAYRLSRALGLGTVPPACLRTVTREQLFAAAGAQSIAPRLEKELRWSKDGKTVEVSMVLWVDGVRSADVDKDRAAWLKLVVQGAALDTIPEALRSHAAEGSRLITFDFLIDNWDRWSGNNTFRLGSDGPFIWLDNAAGFGDYTGVEARRNVKQLQSLERFSKRLVAALRSVDDKTLEAALAPAGLAKRAIVDLLARRAALLEQVNALTKRHGEDQVLCFD